MAFLGQEEQLRELQDRFKYLNLILFVCASILILQLVNLQILSGEKLRRSAEQNRIKHEKIRAPRGMILDRDLTLLVDNHPAFDLEITPQYLKESGKTKETISLLSKLINMPERTIMAKLHKARMEPPFKPVTIKSSLSREDVAKIETWKIEMPGVAVAADIKRKNLYGDLAAHLLGYIGEVERDELDNQPKSRQSYLQGDYIGKFGIEKEMENTLRGYDGEELFEVDAIGRRMATSDSERVLRNELERKPVPGKNLILTIDQDLQLAALKAFGDKVGGLVAMDPNTGEILAMISRPAFDSTLFSRKISTETWKNLVNNPDLPMRDKTIQDHYPPGSVFKIITAITGLEEGVIDERTTFTCLGKMKVGNREMHCHKRAGHGTLTLTQAIERSCDIFFYKVAQKLQSVDQIANWAFKFGLGKKTGIPLAREVPGNIPTEEWKLKRYHQEWSQGETLSVAIGQSFVDTTILQLANMYSAIANGGTLYRPYFIKSIEDYDGSVVQNFEPEVMEHTGLKAKTRELVQKGLWAVVNEPHGTAHSQYLPEIEFSGKTGTSQVMRIAAEHIYKKCSAMPYRSRHHGVFAGYAPSKDPKIVVAVLAEHACAGSTGAGPIGREVIKTFMKKYYPDLLKTLPNKKVEVPVNPEPGESSE